MARVAATERPAAAPGSYERAERLHEALEGRPEQQRTRAEYNRVLDAYRLIYHSDPASPHADASISAVAGLLAEEGRIFQEPKSFNDSIAEYEFLRREYPASRYRYSALLTEGEIYLRDLGDRGAASAIFQSFIKLYPRNALTAEARQDLSHIEADELAETRAANRKGRVSSPPPASRAETRSNLPSAGSRQAGGTDKAARGTSNPAPAGDEPAISSATTISRPSASRTRPAAQPFSQPQVEAQAPSQTPTPAVAVLSAPPPPRRGRLPLVTGLRHWSTPVYTRVAIDLQDEVQYEAARVPDPDRIFFDLHGARLSPELIGKSVQVTDDGFLKRIRVAQSSPDVARIVLDVSDVSDYSAFLLPNPYRLIIDIHGRKPGAPAPAQTASAPGPSQLATGRRAPGGASTGQSSQVPDQPAHSPAPGQQSSPVTTYDPAQATTRARPTQPASNSTTATATSRKSAQPSPGVTPDQAAFSMQDVVTLDRQPNKVKATRGPTSAPISASVAGTTPAPQPKQGAASLNRSQGSSTTSPPPSRSTRGSQNSESTAGVSGTEATATGTRSLSRALGLKIGRIVVDAGHGGHDSGTLGPGGIEEKDVVLDVSLRLGRLLRQRLGADVIFTRDDDTFIPLETRTAIANKAQADLFISVHANSSQDPNARGVETYYLSFTSSADALEVAARENAVSQQSIHQLADLVKKIAMQDKIDESREFAADVERSLYDGLTTGQSQNAGLHDRGVKKAPFVVLIGANMPSILAEISFLTNPEDAQQLRSPVYRQRIAESLYLGIARYVGGMNGVRLADSGLPH